MAAVNILDALEPLVAPTLRRAPRSLIEQKCREVLREFCRTTRCWMYTPAAQNIVATQASYNLVTPGAYAEVIAAQWVRVSNPAGNGGDPARRREVNWFDQMMPSWRVSSGDDFRYYAQELPGSIIFPSKPASAIVGGLEYRVSLRPSIVATQLDDSVTNEFGEEIAHGVRAMLYGMHGEEWSNEKAARDEHGHYTAGRGRARIKINKRFMDESEPPMTFTNPNRFA